MERTQLATTELGSTGLRITRAGFRRPDQVDSLTAAAGLELGPDDIAALAGRR
jgi:hypothetical protein